MQHYLIDLTRVMSLQLKDSLKEGNSFSLLFSKASPSLIIFKSGDLARADVHLGAPKFMIMMTQSFSHFGISVCD